MVGRGKGYKVWVRWGAGTGSELPVAGRIADNGTSVAVYFFTAPAVAFLSH